MRECVVTGMLCDSAHQPIMSEEDEVIKDPKQEAAILKFCPICGAKMYQVMRYGFLCWICREWDFDEPV